MEKVKKQTDFAVSKHQYNSVIRWMTWIVPMLHVFETIVTQIKIVAFKAFVSIAFDRFAATTVACNSLMYWHCQNLEKNLLLDRNLINEK